MFFDIHYVVYTTNGKPLYDDDGDPMFFIWYDLMEDEQMLMEAEANDNKRSANDNV
ncbi:MAG: hypothetical protein KAT90_06370 [Gammaproteobacteria bacterium]|nr:hypothetical protein [Gammaproteobacteria bacterium]